MSIPTAPALAEPIEINYVATVKFQLDEKDATNLFPQCIVFTPLKNPDDGGYIFIPTPHLHRYPSKEEWIPGRPIPWPVNKLPWILIEIIEPCMHVGCVDAATFFFFEKMWFGSGIKYIGGQQLLDELMLTSGGSDPVNFGKRLATQIVQENLARHEPCWWHEKL